MEAPQKDVKNGRFGAVRRWFEDFVKACIDLLDAFEAEVDVAVEEYLDMDTTQAVEKAVEETVKENPELALVLDKTKAVIWEQQKQLEKQFGDENNINVIEKDEDGYNKIPDKISGTIKAEVSEEKARAETNNRPKEGKQKTRVEED